MRTPVRLFAFAALFALGTSAALAGGTVRPVVVELFTSQGCSSCPPADALLGKLARRPDVLAMSLPITYWDMLGWKDTLASEANTRRQKAYAAAMGHGGVYTPQIIVDGAIDVVGSRAAAVEAAIAQRRAAIIRAAAEAAQAEALARADAAPAAMPIPASLSTPQSGTLAADAAVPVAVTETPDEMHVVIGAVPGASTATVWMFHLRSSVSVNIPSGENEGRTVTYHNVVGDLRAIGVYKGHGLSLSLPRSAMANLPHDGVAVVVQQGGYGHVIGAAYVSHPDFSAEK